MNTNISNTISQPNAARRRKMRGASIIEIVVVLVILGILTAMAIPSIYNSRRLFKSEEQALKILDLMREANQLALTRRRPMRLEIDITANQILIIDENAPGNGDDRQVKAIPLLAINEARVDSKPTQVTKPNPPNYNDAVFAVDNIGHINGSGQNVVGNTVWAAKFMRDGSVTNAAGTPLSANLYVWTPPLPGKTWTDSETQRVRAITMFGGSGAVRYWKHNGTTFKPS